MKLYIFLFTSLCITTSIQAQSYSPQGFYDVSYHELNNGMRIIMKNRGEARNVAIRLAVEVGFDDFSCDKRETPHFLEHLLFTGTSQHDEYELERILEDRGGSSNATTSRYKTTYEIDIYNDHMDSALDYLFEIITASVFSPEDVEATRNIINREREGSPSALLQYLYRNGIGKSAEAKGLEMFGLACPQLITPNNISRDEIMAAYAKYYIPNNMVISIVGNFSEQAALSQLKNGFGRLAKEKIDPRGRQQITSINGPIETEGTLAPIIDSDAQVGMSYITPGENAPELYVMRVIEEYLDDVIEKRVRTERGLAYSPSVYMTELKYVSIFDVFSDVDIGEIENVLQILESEIDALANGQIDINRPCK